MVKEKPSIISSTASDINTTSTFGQVIFAPLTAAVYSSLVAQHLLPGSSDHHGLAGFGSGLLWLATPDASVSAAAPEIEVWLCGDMKQNVSRLTVAKCKDHCRKAVGDLT